MKQHITQKQWDELDDEQKLRLCYGVDSIEEQSSPIFKLPNIGQMIEFLGEDLFRMCNTRTKWTIASYEKTGKLEEVKFKSKELCNVLWEAVKYKIT